MIYGTFALFFLFAMASMHVLHIITYRHKLDKYGVYHWAATLGFATFAILKLMAGQETKVLYQHWYITTGLVVVAYFLYDAIQFRYLEINDQDQNQ